jgi:hypothetical protein
MPFFSRGSLWVIPIAILAWPVYAQVATTGQVVGRAQDASGAVVPGVALRLENTATEVAQNTLAAEDGGFVFPSVQPGVYRLTATMKGFDTAVYTDIVVNAARTTNQPVSLKIGSVNATVEVAGAAPVLQLSNTTVSNTVEQKYLQDLPLPGREALPFALLTSGAQQGVTARDSTFGPRGAAVRTPDQRRAAGRDGARQHLRRDARRRDKHHAGRRFEQRAAVQERRHELL